MNFFTKLIMGTNRPESKPRSVYLKETIAFKQIWNNKSYNDFGLERMLRLVLILSSFIMPGTLIRQLCGRKQLLIRKVVIEGYSLFKIGWYYFLFEADLTTSTTALVISLVLTIDTVHFMFSKIFLNDIHKQPISFKRTLLMTLINILEVILCFGFIYSYIDDTNQVARWYFPAVTTSATCKRFISALLLPPPSVTAILRPWRPSSSSWCWFRSCSRFSSWLL